MDDPTATIPVWYLRALSLFAHHIRSADGWGALVRLAELRWGPLQIREAERWPLGHCNDLEVWEKLEALRLVRLHRKGRRILRIELVTDYRAWQWDEYEIARRDAEIGATDPDVAGELATEVLRRVSELHEQHAAHGAPYSRRWYHWRAVISEALERYPAPVWQEALAGFDRMARSDKREILLPTLPTRFVAHLPELVLLGRAQKIPGVCP